MGIYNRFGRLACLLLAVSVSDTSFAQGAQPCTCLLPDAGTTASVGEIVAVDGDVLMSQADGYSAALQGMSVVKGAQILVGAQSSASAVFGGNCPLDATAGTIVRVDPTQAGVCVSLAQRAEPVLAQTTIAPAPQSARGLLAAALGFAAVGGAVALIVGSGDDDDDDSVSD